MAAIYPYLIFDNAKRAMDYYVHQFGAEIISREPLGPDQVEAFGLHPENLAETTAHGEFRVAGQTIVCADATMANPQSSSLVSIMLDFAGDGSGARALFDRLAASGDQRVTMPYGQHPAGGALGEIVDRYGITWLISAGAVESEN